MIKSSAMRKSALVVLAIISAASLSVSAFAASSRLGVTRVDQKKGNWCWAACAEIVGDYVYGGSSRTQGNVVSFTHGSEVNDGGSNAETAAGIEYVAFNTVTAFDTGTETFDFFKDKIIDKKPTVFGVKWQNSDSGHQLVVSGYNDTGEKLYVVDPATGRASMYVPFTQFEGTDTLKLNSGTGTYNATIYVD